MNPAEPKKQGSESFRTQHARTMWIVLSAAVAIVAGFVTLNMTLADSGIVVMNQHLTPVLTALSRLRIRG